jgi:Na+/H+ antiporter NhaA
VTELTPALWLMLFTLQTLGFYWLGRVILGRNIHKSAIHTGLLSAVIGVIIGLAMGVPLWRDNVYGDAYDHGVAAWLCCCAFIGFQRWINRVRS